MSSLNCPEEVLLAEKLVDINPGLIWLSLPDLEEANAIAIRIARSIRQR